MLSTWVADRTQRQWRGRGADTGMAVDQIKQLVSLVSAVHALGLVLRDLNPMNTMVTTAGILRLIDFGSACAVGSHVLGAVTRGYASPEQMSGDTFGSAPGQTTDLYSLGATILYLVSGVDPLLAPDSPLGRLEHRTTSLVRLMAPGMPAVRQLAPLILGLMRDAPAKRWSTAEARSFLESVRSEGDRIVQSPRLSRPPVPATRLLSDGVAHLAETMQDGSSWLWPTNAVGRRADPCSLQLGAAGPLAVLTEAARHQIEGSSADAVATAARWMHQRLFDLPRLLPGLYFGRSGTAWALYEAAAFLGDAQMRADAVALAKQVPLNWPNPDICHGTSGAGMAQLNLWLATGDPEFLRRAVLAADALMEAERQLQGRAFWPIPDTFDSALAGAVQYGFGHGVAGVGTVLLYVGLATGHQGFLDAAVRAGETLTGGAVTDDTAAWWPSGPVGDQTRRQHWCSGSSGVGTFLIRLWTHTGDDRHLQLAVKAAVAVRRGRWYSPLCACHGLPGNGEYLLDLAGFTGQQRYLDWAEELAAVMYTRRSVRGGKNLLPDESGSQFTVSHGGGLAGSLTFLHRLTSGGARRWMTDQLLRCT